LEYEEEVAMRGVPGGRSAAWRIGAAFLTIAVSLWGASCGAELRASRAETVEVAARIRSGFSAIRIAEDSMVATIESVYAESASLDLSVGKMDVEDGGVFATFEGNKYYYKTLRSGCSYYCSPLRPVDDAMRREIRIMGYFEGALQKASESLPPYLDIIFYGIHEPLSIAMLYPAFDIVSIFPPGVRFTDFEWYDRGLESPGPGRWSALPFADLINGWVMDFSKPVKAGGATKGVAVISVDIMKASEYYLGKAVAPLVLIASDSTLMGASPKARALFGLAPLEDEALVKQMTANRFVPSAQRLDDASRPADIRSLASRVLAGESRFEQRIGAASWAVESIRIPEIGFYLVGLGRH
jgi:hypothetical protein